MKYLAAIVVLIALPAPLAAAPKLVKKWETEASLKVPESVLHDAARGVLYVTNIDGEPWGDDGRGSIGKVGLDGKVIAVDWVTGLSAPKGMALHGNRLYIGDIDRVVVVDVEKGTIIAKIAIPGSHGINDVTVDAAGVVYASDSRDKKIHSIRDGKVSLVIEGLAAPNGVHCAGGELYFMDNGGLFRLGKAREKILVAAGKPGNGDGLESLGDGGFIITYWPGVYDYARLDGTRETLLDTSAEKINAADLGYNSRDRTIYVPTFFKNTVIAYEVR